MRKVCDAQKIDNFPAKSTILIKSLRKTWWHFCKSTSIHGLKYTNDNNSSRFAKISWLIITLIMFICAIVMVFTFYLDFISNPTRMNIENDHTPISYIMFPAVTVCPANSLNLRRAKAFIDTLEIGGNMTTKYLINTLYQLYGFIDGDVEYNETQILDLQMVVEKNQLTISSLVGHLQWKCGDILFRCRFQSRIVNCRDIFKISRTYIGNCCSFNVSQTGGVNFSRSSQYGFRGGLSIIMHDIQQHMEVSKSYSQGLKVMIHANDVFPNENTAAKFVPRNQESFITVRPIETFCSDAVNDLMVSDRQCVFPNEFPLRHFKTYNTENCEVNCRIQNTIATCGCVPYFFLKFRADIKICDLINIRCLVDNFELIIGRNNVRKVECECPNSCEGVSFDVQLNEAKLQYNVDSIDAFYTGIKEGSSVAHIYMNSQVYRRLRRDLLSSTVTLISNLGSAFSLFIGMSMISAVEIFYFFTMIFRKKLMAEKESAKNQMLFIRTVNKNDVNFKI